MHTIVIASRKGGAGKTTIGMHLAVEAVRHGDGPVAIIDSDPMGGAAGWYNERKSDNEYPTFLQVGQGGLRATLDAAGRAGIRLVIIDTPPAASDAIHSIIECSDLVIIPVIPSPNDLRAVGETVELVERAGRKFLFVLNSASSRAILTGKSSRLLSSDGPVAATVIENRQDYRSAMIDGRVASELKANSKAAQDISALWTDISSKLHNEGRHRGQGR
jgi:chromosome partitioning protein